MKIRLEAQTHRIAGINQHGEEHQQVAEIQLQPEQRREVAVGGRECNAAKRQHEAGHLPARDPHAKDQEIGHEDDERHARLFNHRIDGAGIVKRAVKECVE